MKKLNQLKNIGIARLANSIPAFADLLTASYTPPKSEDIPWAPIKKPLHESKIALITTAGIHHVDQKPFNMNDPAGDPTYHMIDTKITEEEYVITHDYYDHRDASSGHTRREFGRLDRFTFVCPLGIHWESHSMSSNNSLCLDMCLKLFIQFQNQGKL